LVVTGPIERGGDRITVKCRVGGLDWESIRVSGRSDSDAVHTAPQDQEPVARVSDEGNAVEIEAGADGGRVDRINEFTNFHGRQQAAAGSDL